MAWPGKEWFLLREQVLERDSRTCRYCGVTPEPYWQSMGWDKERFRSGVVVDHVIPKARGGTDDIENLVTACEPCNLEKHANVWVPIPL